MLGVPSSDELGIAKALKRADLVRQFTKSFAFYVF